MSHIEAVYRRGVFEPLGPVNLREEERVRLSIELAAGESPLTWLSRVQGMQNAFRSRAGELPDSAVEIAADRLR